MSSIKSNLRHINLLTVCLYWFLFNPIFNESSFSQTSEKLPGSGKESSLQEVIEFSLNLYKGEITKVEKKFKKDIPVWVIDMNASNGGSISFEISSGGNILLGIKAVEGPFDYDIKPGEEFVSLSSAKKTAEEFTSQKVLKWEFKQVKEKFEYGFWLFTKNGKAQVRVDAVSGEIITKRKTKKK